MPGSPALYFNVLPFGSHAAGSFDTLISVAHNVMAQAGLSDLRKSGIWAAGRTANSHAAIAFIGGDYTSTNAVIMVAGDDAYTVLDKLTTGLRNVKFL